MLVPYGLNCHVRKTPWVNFSIIALCILFFFLSDFGRAEGWIRALALWSGSPRPHQLVSYILLHEGWLHLIGNLVFLWAFGNAVNGRLGDWRFASFFVASGILAGIGHLILGGSNAYVKEIIEEVQENPLAGGVIGQDRIESLLTRGLPLVGASGAIMGVAGLSLAFFPLNNVKVFILILIRPVFFEVVSFLLIGVYVGLDVLMMLMSQEPGVAYAAHVAGFAAGFAFGIISLRVGWVPRDDYDFLSWMARGGRMRPGTAIERLQAMKGRGARDPNWPLQPEA